MSRPAPGARSEPQEWPSAAALSSSPHAAPSHQAAPAPWSLVSASVVDGRGEFHLFVADRDGRKIAAVWTRGEEKLATGSLMAAAPALLAAAKKMLARPEVNGATYNANIGLAQTADELSAAIAAAEVRS